MTDAVETMAYAGEKPWHGLGFEVNNNLSSEQMLKAAKLDWAVKKEPLFLQGKDGVLGKQIKEKFALVRESDSSVLSIVGRVYKPVQNENAMSFFKKFVDAGHMAMETAGSLHGGRYIWALAKIGADFRLGKSDEVRGYLLLCSPHISGKALVCQFTPVRVVCWNTLSMALGANLKDRAGAFRMPHSMEFNDDVKARAELALGIAKESMDVFKTQASALAKKKVSKTVITDYFYDILEVEAEVRKEVAAGDKPMPRLLTKMEEALVAAPGHDLDTAKGTLWGAFNAVTYVADHQMGNTSDSRLKGAWLGGAARMKRRALKLAMELTK